MVTDSHNLDKKAKAVWAISGGKGGVGRTLLAANLGILMADDGYDVIVADCDLDGPTLHTALGIEPPDKTLSDYTSGYTQSLEEIVTDTPINGLRIISGAKNAMNSSNYNHSAKSKLISSLHTLECDYLIADTGSGACFDVIDLFLSADIGILVTTPELSSIELTYRFIKSLFYRQLRTLVEQPQYKDYVDEIMNGKLSSDLLEIVEKVLKKVKGSDITLEQRVEKELFNLDLKLVVTMARTRQDQLTGFSMAEIVKKYYGLNLRPIGHIPYDDRMPETTKKRTPFIREYDTSDTAAFFNIAKKELLKSTMGKEEKQLDLIES
ncbi:hypothetical protein MNBD_NITROSPINAE02-92 [hydrothermal vent metagenome]|uniref:CobQ/CobB/MinD/ParA nucleotide binding domain-containing protein n=1 Tax=hydrothermal vent metagenome TaxID=652676 RepID=A0A3B1BDD2_9ZZZZ